MNKKLLVVAVAGALAVPGVAMAQVTISGKVGAMWQSIAFSGATAATRAGGKTSIDHIIDNSSALTFQMREDLGGGMAAFGRIELRPTIDGQGGGSGTGASGSTPMWVGLESTSWGNLRVGTLSGLHNVSGPDYGGVTGTPFNSTHVIMGGTATAGTVHAMATRLRNAIAWDSLNYGGFKMTVAYSSSGAGVDNDLGTSIRKGRTWNFIPQFIQPNWNIGYSYYDQKPDAGTGTNSAATTVAAAAAAIDEKGQRLFGEYDLRNGFKLGGAWDSYKRTAAVGGIKAQDRRAYSLQGMYVTGPHQVAVTYAKASNDKVLGTNTGANQIGVGYMYSMSKRTNAFATYQRVTNQSAAAYYAAGMPTPAYTGSAGMAALAGEDYRIIQVGMNHSF